jgi:hypothetical protein
MLHEQHTAVHAFHHHIPHREQGSSGTGIIWLLVLLHAFFLGYWGEPPPPPGVAWQQQQAQAPAVCVAWLQCMLAFSGHSRLILLAHPLAPISRTRAPVPSPLRRAAWIWWRQRLQREVAARKTSALPQKVNCVYDWTPVIPQVRGLPACGCCLGCRAAASALLDEASTLTFPCLPPLAAQMSNMQLINKSAQH